jgi:hypothetical protein
VETSGVSGKRRQPGTTGPQNECSGSRRHLVIAIVFNPTAPISFPLLEPLAIEENLLAEPNHYAVQPAFADLLVEFVIPDTEHLLGCIL